MTNRFGTGARINLDVGDRDALESFVEMFQRTCKVRVIVEEKNENEAPGKTILVLPDVKE